MSNPKKKIDLTPSLKRPMDPAAMSTDSATLRALVGQLNNPAITGAEVPEDEVAGQKTATSRPAPSAGSPTIPQDSIPTAEEQQQQVTKAPGLAGSPRDIQPSPTPGPFVTSPSPVKVKKLVLLTGRNADKVANAIRQAEKFRLYGPVSALAAYLFPGFDEKTEGAAQTLGEIIAWGNGEINEDYPVSTQRIVFIKMIRSLAGVLGGAVSSAINWATFGTGGFWVDACLNSIKDYTEKNPNGQVFLLGIITKLEFEYFIAQGFSHWHVMSPRSPGGDDINSMLDNSVTRQISQQRDGAKLKCVWSEDRTPPVSSRLWSLADFVKLF